MYIPKDRKPPPNDHKPPRPLLARSLEQLVSWAELPKIDHEVKCVLYVKSALRLFEQANEYWLEGELEYAYIYFLKFATLCIEALPKHKGYHDQTVETYKSQLTEKCQEALSYLEELKESLKVLYSDIPPPESPIPNIEDIQVAPGERLGDSDLFDYVPNCPEPEKSEPEKKSSDQVKTGQLISFSSSESSSSPSPEKTSQFSALNSLINNGPYLSYHPNQGSMFQHTPDAPQPGDWMSGRHKRKKVRLIPHTQEELEKMMAMTPVLLNKQMFEHFLQIFIRNTTEKVESCGILSGRHTPEGIKVTTLILPKQTGTGDSCQTIDEFEVFTYQTENQLMPVGWIHTHPTQDCFLSSVDLHMQYGYQTILPEAIAVVLAPRRKRCTGIFQITPRGMRAINKCKETGFHPHLETGLYQQAAHVRLTDGEPEYQVVDLR